MGHDKVIVADDHPLFREGIGRLIRRFMPGKIVEVADFEALLDEIQRDTPPALMILDLIFPGFDGGQSVARLRQENPQSAIIIISMSDAPSLAAELLEAGANGFISKSVPPKQMAQGISDVMDGELVLLLDAQPEATPDPMFTLDDLAPRHVEILVRLGQGKSNKEIARELDISPFTVRAHMSALFRKLGVSSRAGAAAFAAQNGLV